MATTEVGAVLSELEVEYARSTKFLDDLYRTLNSRGEHLSRLPEEREAPAHVHEADDVEDAATSTDVPAASEQVPGSDTDQGSSHAPCHNPAPRQPLDCKPAVLRFDAPEATGISKSGLAARMSKKLLNMFNRSTSLRRSGDEPSPNGAPSQASAMGVSTAPANPPPTIAPPALPQFVSTATRPGGGHHRRASVEILPSTAALLYKSLENAPGSSMSGTAAQDMVRAQQQSRRASCDVPSQGYGALVGPGPSCQNPGNAAYSKARRASIASYSLPPVSPQQPGQPLQAWQVQQQPRGVHTSQGTRREQQSPPQQAQAAEAAAVAAAPTPASVNPWAEAASVSWAAAHALRPSMDVGGQAWPSGGGAAQSGSADRLPPLPPGHSTAPSSLCINGVAPHVHHGGGGPRSVSRRSSGTNSGDFPRTTSFNDHQAQSTAGSAAGTVHGGVAHHKSGELSHSRFSSRIALLAQPGQPATPLATSVSIGSALSPSGDRDASLASRQRRSSHADASLERLPTGKSPRVMPEAGGGGENDLVLEDSDADADADGGATCSRAASGGGGTGAALPSAPLPPLSPQSARGTEERELRGSGAYSRVPRERMDGAAADGGLSRHGTDRSDHSQEAAPRSAWAQSSLFAPSNTSLRALKATDHRA